ncbi:J domain-containing protein [Methanosarcina sp. Mfa9]|uniref:J domain-containing protein n=1 Tax=Methanosarcina sp. Mfa9 TaxID=3439063 RepID=UPI003F86B6E5
MDYYQLLDIPRVASPEDIENRYLLLVKKYHPDRSKSPDAHEKFIKIKEAYETLKNPWKRKVYDASLPPEEKAVEASSEPEDPEGFSSDSDAPSLDSSISPVPDQPVSGSKGAFKSTGISYVSFKSDRESYSSSPASSSKGPGESGKPERSKYLPSEKSLNLHDRSKEVSYGSGQNSADWSYVKVKYEGIDEDIDDATGKKSGFSAGFTVRKAFRYAVVLICIFLILTIVSPDLVGAKASGFGAVTETFDKVVLLAKSLV